MLTHKGTLELETDRLLLRRFELDDGEDMFNNWANDKAVTKYLTWPTHQDVEVTKKLVESWAQSYHAMDRYFWAITLKDSRGVIGSISVVSLSEKHENCELGYCIGRRFWGKGIVTEALQLVIEFLFNEIGFERIAAHHDIENVASGCVMKKAGMKYEGRLRHVHKNMSGDFADCDVYAIVKETGYLTERTYNRNTYEIK